MGSTRYGPNGINFGDDHFIYATARHSPSGGRTHIEREYVARHGACMRGIKLGELRLLA
jgi:hypothetical protein